MTRGGAQRDRGDAERRRQLGEDDRAHDPDPLRDEAADELARRPAGEEDGERAADAGHRDSLLEQEEGEEREQRRARRGVDHPDRGERLESARVPNPPAAGTDADRPSA